MKNRIYHNDIRKIHLIILLIGLVTGFLVLETLILADQYRRSMEDDVLAQFYGQQINLARQTAGGIDKFMEDILRDLELLSQDPRVKTSPPGAVESTLKQFYHKNRRDVVHFYRLDSDGIMTDIYPASRVRGEDFSYRAYFKAVKEREAPFVSRFLQVRERYWTLVLAHPISGVEPGAPFSGLVAATVSVEKINERFFERISLVKTGYGWLLDSEGTVIINPEHPDLVGKNVASLVGSPGEFGLEKISARMKAGEEGIGKYSYEHVQKYAAFSPFHLGGRLCAVAVCVPIDEVKQFMQKTSARERILLIFVVVTMVLAGGALMFLTRRIYLMRMEEQTRDRRMEAMALKRKLTQSQKLATIGELAAGIAHEMRNPLISIRTAGEMLKDSPNHDEEERALSLVIHKEARKLEDFIREFLMYARPPRLNRTRFQLNRLVERIITEARGRPEFGSDVHIETVLSKDLPVAYLDETHISLVLWNLLQNAIDAMSGAGTIRIATHWEPSGEDRWRKNIILTVADTGGGVDTSVSGKIFYPFFSTKAHGVGMGLATVQQIVEAHDGDIQLIDGSLSGACFAIRLPLMS